MDKDFEQAEAIRKAKQLEQDREDFNNEMAGNEVGRMARFGFDKVRKETEQQDKKRKQQSALDLLLQDTEYHEAWTNAMTALDDADQTVYDALVAANESLTLAQKEHEALQNQESKEKLEQADAHFNQVRAHELRLAEIREELEDKDNPASIERVNELTELSKQIAADVSVKSEQTSELEIKDILPAAAPDLAL